jgi:hypothetical protein
MRTYRLSYPVAREGATTSMLSEPAQASKNAESEGTIPFVWMKKLTARVFQTPPDYLAYFSI